MWTVIVGGILYTHSTLLVLTNRVKDLGEITASCHSRIHGHEKLAGHARMEERVESLKRRVADLEREIDSLENR